MLLKCYYSLIMGKTDGYIKVTMQTHIFSVIFEYQIFALKSIRFPYARTHILNGKWALQFFISYCGIESKRNKSIPSIGRNKTFKSKIFVNKENFPDEESLKTHEPWSSSSPLKYMVKS
ncbi:Hypothetical_protein [Hexamita inflata]|uniref:Hypothetical_protein n=1 Tax=Hexamita inflata TaxID=28002 RepID=A0AA86TTG5_9EUKA|nr:Hypothetical protein HINF_LOCUS15751 [Hexamita inflata]